jgi:hypothetical protein
MAQYPAPPPLRLPDGTLVPMGMQGTQQTFAPTEGAMPYRQPMIDPALDFAPATPSRAAGAGALGNKPQLFSYQDDPRRAAVQGGAMRPPRFLNAARDAFGEHMDRLTLQVKQTFDQTLHETSAERARSIRSVWSSPVTINCWASAFHCSAMVK